MSFGVIIRVESEAFQVSNLARVFKCSTPSFVDTHVFDFLIQVLKGVPDRPEVALVKLREIKCKIDKKISVQDWYKNTVAAKDVLRIIEGPCKVSPNFLA